MRLQRLRLEEGRTFGDVWLGWTLWRARRLDEALAGLLPKGREAVPWATRAAVLVLAPLCESSNSACAASCARARPRPPLLDRRGLQLPECLLIRSPALEPASVWYRLVP